MNKSDTPEIVPTETTPSIEIDWGNEEHELLRDEVFKHTDPLIMGYSNVPTSNYGITNQIIKDFGIEVDPAKVQRHIDPLLEKKLGIRWKNLSNPHHEKLFLNYGEASDDHFTSLIESQRRLLNYILGRNFEPHEKISNRVEKLTKSLFRKNALKRIDLILIRKLFDGPKHSYQIMEEIQNDLNVKINPTTLESLLPRLLGMEVIEYADHGCSECGRPPGWVYENNKWRLKYTVTIDNGIQYYTLKLNNAINVLNHAVDTYIKTRKLKNQLDFTDWPRLEAQEKPKKPYEIILD